MKPRVELNRSREMYSEWVLLRGGGVRKSFDKGKAPGLRFAVRLYSFGPGPQGAGNLRGFRKKVASSGVGAVVSGTLPREQRWRGAWGSHLVTRCPPT
jgi:hypothetical protein